MKQPQCNAKSKGSGQRCKRPVVPGSTKCRYHGGLSPRGIASPAYKTGKYSKYLPARLLERYEASLSDNKALSLREDIAVTDTRISELITRIDAGESGAAWQQARSAFGDLRIGFQTQDTTMINEAMRQLNAAISAGQADYKTWSELHATIDQRRKLVESERRLMVELQQMLTTEDAMLLFDGVAQSIKRNVTDVATLRAIQADLSTLFGTNANQPVDAGITIEGELD